MDEVAPRFRKHRCIGLDTSVFIYVLEHHPIYAKAASEVLRLVQNGGPTGVTSVVTIMETLVKPLQLNQIETAREYERLIRNFPNLSVIEIDLSMSRHAAALRARYGLGAPDALHVAACISAGATVFVTNDSVLRRIQELEVIVLSDVV